MSDTPTGLASLALLTQCGEMSRNFAAQIAAAAAAEIRRLDGEKADKGESVPVTLTPASWRRDDGAQDKWPYCCDIAVDGLTSRDMATLCISRVSAGTACECGLCPVNETLDPPEGSTAGIIRLWTAAVPQTEITAVYRIDKGKE